MNEPADPPPADPRSPTGDAGSGVGAAETASSAVRVPRPRSVAAKEPGALRTIGEVADALGIRQHVLRYWEDQFPMLRPLKRSGGRRYYRPEDVDLLERIHRLVHREGYTLRGARLVLEGKPVPLAPAPVMPPPAGAAPTAQPAGGSMAERLRAVRNRLAAALDG